jgi:hypothetical protein
MITKCKFDKNKDFQETVPNLAMSVQMALTTGIIKDSGTNSPYNEVESTAEVGHYLHDTIDIAMASKKLGIAMNSANPTSTEIDASVQ